MSGSRCRPGGADRAPLPMNIRLGKALPGMSLDHYSRRGQRRLRGPFSLPDDGVTHWHMVPILCLLAHSAEPRTRGMPAFASGGLRFCKAGKWKEWKRH
jgi:hypothetical protein